MDVSKLSEYEKLVLVNAVKLCQRKQLVGPSGSWKEWLAAQDEGNKLSDPKRHSVERLATFLSTLDSQLPDPKSPGKKLVKPKKLLKRVLPWLQKCLQEDQAIAKAAAAGPSPEQAGTLSLIQRTRNHPRYKQKYDFPSYEQGWLRTDRLPLPNPSQPLVLLGLDCEMCVSADSEKELLQVAVVDQEGRQIMKELVKPSSQVLDYKSELTGITAAHMEGVETDRHAVAAKIKKLLTPGTVLVGHSLHYDLEALKLDHQPVIDTAMLFSYQGLANATPSLTHLAGQLLGRKLRGGHDTEQDSQQQQQQQQQPHDSVEDASAALALVKRELQRLPVEGPTPPLPPPGTKVDKGDQSKLCVHKIPQGTTAAAVQAAFTAACKKAVADGAAAAAAVEQASIEEGGGMKQQLLLVFPHPGLANDAFAALPGNVFTDSMGRHSKRLQLTGSSSHVVVRKMVCHNGMAYGKDKAKDRGAKKGGKKKKGENKRPAGLSQMQQGKIGKKQKKQRNGAAKAAAAVATA